MDTIELVSAIFTILGMPSIFIIIFYVHKKHINILKERIKILEERSPEKLLQVLEASRKLSDEYITNQEKQYNDKIKYLEKSIMDLKNTISIMNKFWSGEDYRYEILKGSTDNK